MQQPIYSLDAEKNVLGALLLNKDLVSEIAELLTPQDFYQNAHGIIYKTILELEEKGITPDLTSVTLELIKTKANIGVSQVADLLNVATTANAMHYAKIVKDRSIERSLVNRLTNIVNKIHDCSYGTSDELLSEAEAAVLEVGQSKNGNIQLFKDMSTDFVKYLKERKPGISGIKTPFTRFNFMTAGLQRKELSILAARPSMGKTSMGTNIASMAALSGLSVAIFSIEMPKEQILARIIAEQALIDVNKFKIGGFTADEWRKITSIKGQLDNCKLYLDDETIVTPLDLRAKCRRIKKQSGLDLVVVDYLQKMTCHKKVDNRNHELGVISGSLKNIAKELDCHILSLAQLSRSVEQRQDKRPMMSDLRDSGNLEQDADLIAFLYNDFKYNPNTEKKGITEVIISKQRNGPTGTIEVGWMSEYTKFYDLERREPTIKDAEELFGRC